MTCSVWTTAQTTAPHQRRGRLLPASAPHPAKMLPDLAAHAVLAYSRPGDLVLDPMCGVGTTLVEAARAGRRALGVEYEPRWARVAADNLAWTRTRAPALPATDATVICGDSRNLDVLVPCHLRGRVDLVLTSPPYGPGVHGRVRVTRETGSRGVKKHDHTYGSDHANLAHAPTGQLLDAFTTILTQCRHQLRPGGHVVITARPWRVNGELVDLPGAVVTCAHRAGLRPVERCVALLGALRDGQFVPHPSFFQLRNVRAVRKAGAPMHLIAHEDVLVFRKPADPVARRPHHRTAPPRRTRCRSARGASTSTSASRVTRSERGRR